MREMRRLPACLLAASAAALAAGACESPTAATTSSLGGVVALASLRSADGADLPCCTVDTAGARASIVGGALTFRARTTFADTVWTPVGPADSTCMNAVPGVYDASTDVVTLADGSTHIWLSCHVGTYTLTLAQQLDLANGRSDTSDIVVSAGTYHWKLDTLSLAATAGLATTAAMSADTFIVSVAGHVYKLQPVPRPD